MEPVVLLRRTVLIVLDVALVLQPRWRYSSFVLLSLVLFASHLLLAPFRTPRDNRIEAVSLLHLVFVSALLTSESLPFTTGMEAVVSIVVLIPALAFLLYLVLDRLHTKYPIARLSKLFPPSPRSPSIPSSPGKDVKEPGSVGSASKPAGQERQDNVNDDAAGVELQQNPMNV
jgi:hypothetical protein